MPVIRLLYLIRRLCRFNFFDKLLGGVFWLFCYAKFRWWCYIRVMGSRTVNSGAQINNKSVNGMPSYGPSVPTSNQCKFFCVFVCLFNSFWLFLEVTRRFFYLGNLIMLIIRFLMEFNSISSFIGELFVFKRQSDYVLFSQSIPT